MVPTDGKTSASHSSAYPRTMETRDAAYLLSELVNVDMRDLCCLEVRLVRKEKRHAV